VYYDSIAKPLYDRGLLAEYPPGSPFKILTGLIGLQEGVIDEQLLCAIMVLAMPQDAL
jgi:penicillin-binding protein 2